MLHLYLQGYLSLILLNVASGFGDTEPILAVQEEDVALTCFSQNDTDPNSFYRYSVTKFATDPNQVKDMFKWPTPSNDVYKRVKWVADGNGQKCLTLTKLQKSDAGLYTCEMWKGWDRVAAKNISLRIKDCKVLEPVKAAPSMPAKLNCPVNMTTGQQEPQNISWAIQKGDMRESLDSSKAKTDGTSLTFQSVNTSDSGWYTCSYTLGKTQRCFDTNLQVQAFVTTTVPVIPTKTPSLPAPKANDISLSQRKEESNDALIAVVVCVILGMIIIAAVIGLVVYRRCKTQRITQLHQRRFNGNCMSTYEIVAPLTNTPGQRINSLYQMPDESLVTCKLYEVLPPL
ncbi:uncharacterized protein LOC102208344 isoform X1 [Pundamilia nyererei]|uniref:Uncharacterized protein LOC102208344 isoform X1 n=1 Tax=Pundamilia nyererei TaxID=303518 RepID=A0A9Y3RMU9_9CICH|nr:PREDICTED: uncharacterized protein LOC102208344 isoform X1 [Pundamilia nyererei]